MKRILHGALICALIVVVSMALWPASVGAQGIAIYVDDDFPDTPEYHALHMWNTIQKGIDDATDNAGDTVYVYAGTYNENVTIGADKRRVTLWGQSASAVTVVAYDSSKPTIEILAHTVTVRQLTIEGGNPGVKWGDSGGPIVSYGTVENCDITGSNGHGVLLDTVTNQTVQCNNVYNNELDGIRVTGSSLKDLFKNHTHYNINGAGIRLHNSIKISTAYNESDNNEYGIYVNVESTQNDTYLNDFHDNTTANVYSEADGNNWETPGNPAPVPSCTEQAPPPPPPPAAPSGLTATAVSSTEIDLSWNDNSDNEDGFKIERSETGGGGSYTEIATVGANFEAYPDTGLSPDTTYYYRVRAYNAAGDSSPAEDSATTLALPDTTPPAAVTDLAVIGGTANSLTLMWTAPGDDGNVGTASQYDIRYSTAAIITAGDWGDATPCDGEPSPQAAGSRETFVVPGLSMVTTYHFALKTADEVTNWSLLSNVPSATTPTPIDTPVGQNVEVPDPSGVVIVFSTVSTADSTTVFESQVNPCGEISGYRFLGKYYNTTTGADYIGPVTVTLPYNEGDIRGDEEEEELHIFRCLGTSWVDVTKSVDTVNNTITGEVPTLSWYAVAGPEEEGGGGGGFCFIATAAYGSYLDGHVEMLRNFRDQYLVTNSVGQGLVSVYYKLSPPVAEFINEHPALKPVVRVGLLPAVAVSTVAVNTTSEEKIAILGSLALVSLALAVWLRKRRGKGSEYS